MFEKCIRSAYYINRFLNVIDNFANKWSENLFLMINNECIAVLLEIFEKKAKSDLEQYPGKIA